MSRRNLPGCVRGAMVGCAAASLPLSAQTEPSDGLPISNVRKFGAAADGKTSAWIRKPGSSPASRWKWWMAAGWRAL
jgi:hypothetical protein